MRRNPECILHGRNCHTSSSRIERLAQEKPLPCPPPRAPSACIGPEIWKRLRLRLNAAAFQDAQYRGQAPGVVKRPADPAWDAQVTLLHAPHPLHGRALGHCDGVRKVCANRFCFNFVLCVWRRARAPVRGC